MLGRVRRNPRTSIWLSRLTCIPLCAPTVQAMAATLVATADTTATMPMTDICPIALYYILVAGLGSETGPYDFSLEVRCRGTLVASYCFFYSPVWISRSLLMCVRLSLAQCQFRTVTASMRPLSPRIRISIQGAYVLATIARTLTTLRLAGSCNRLHEVNGTNWKETVDAIMPRRLAATLTRLCRSTKDLMAARTYWA
jgi:hypothetical protein